MTGIQLADYAGTPWQMFGEGPPEGIVIAPGFAGTSCQGQVVTLGARWGVEPSPGEVGVQRILRPEAWAYGGGPASSPADLRVEEIGETEVVWASVFATFEAWYSVPYEDGFIVTFFLGDSVSQEEFLGFIETFLSYDP